MKNILVIEDEQGIRESIIELLELKNYSVTGARDGEEGLQMLEKELPDLVICDIMMPGLTGYEVLRKIRQRKGFFNTPFLFLSAKSQGQDVRQGMNLGADDYLTKPFQAKDLFGAVEARLNRQELLKIELNSQLKSLEQNGSIIEPQEVSSSINSIIDTSSLLLEQFQHYAEDDVKALIGRIKDVSEELERKVKNTLTYQSLELAQYDDNVRKTLGRGCLRDALQKIKASCIKIAKKYDRESDLFFLDSDTGDLAIAENNFDLIITELLHNAFSYAKQGTMVSIEARKVDKQYHLLIRNHATQELLVSPESTFDAVYYKNHGKPGLGLYLVQQISKLNKGNLELSVEDGQVSAKLIIPIK
ncbi:MAG: response regulator [Bacteroidota bacterium]